MLPSNLPSLIQTKVVPTSPCEVVGVTGLLDLEKWRFDAAAQRQMRFVQLVQLLRHFCRLGPEEGRP